MAVFYKWNEKTYQNEKTDRNWTEITVEEAFPFLKERGHVVSLVGAGGKTTLMFTLARQCAARGMHVLVSTTTHIMKPLDGTYIKTTEELLAHWRKHSIAVAGEECAEGKLAMPSPNCLKKWMSMADIVFLEADGSKRLPLKVPAEKEPVLLESCDIVIAVAGMSALGQPLENVCFRLAHAETLLGKTGKERVTENDYAKILTSESGECKNVENREYYMVLNQCDGETELAQAKRIAQEIQPEYRTRVYAACLKN
jgi:probable selenium-dependent hydroxylase accessory protein YqeC